MPEESRQESQSHLVKEESTKPTFSAEKRKREQKKALTKQILATFWKSRKNTIQHKQTTILQRHGRLHMAYLIAQTKKPHNWRNLNKTSCSRHPRIHFSSRTYVFVSWTCPDPNVNLFCHELSVRPWESEFSVIMPLHVLCYCSFIVRVFVYCFIHCARCLYRSYLYSIANYSFSMYCFIWGAHCF